MNRAKQVIFTAIMIALMCTNISATNYENTDTDIRFSVEAILPDNQVDQEVTYFHLLLNNTHKQQIKVKVINLKSEPITVIASANNASTNHNGIIEYGSIGTAEKQSIIEPSFESIVSVVNEKINLAAYESKEFLFDVTMTDTVFEGIILGGLVFKLEEDASGASGVSQTYSYNIATVLSQSTDTLKSSKLFDFINISPIVKDGYKYMSAKFENQDSKILSNLMIDAKIYKDSSDTVLYQKRQESMEMAPHTALDFNIDTGKKNLASGRYRYVIEATSFKQKWQWESTFEIDDSVAKEVNVSSLNQVTVPAYFKYSITISVIVTVINGVLILKESRKRGNAK